MGSEQIANATARINSQLMEFNAGKFEMLHDVREKVGKSILMKFVRDDREAI